MSNKKPLMSRDPLAEIADATDPVPASSGSDPVDQGAAGPMVLPAVLTISEVGELHDVLRTALQDGLPVELDGAAIESVDGAGLQLLAGFFKSADEASLPVTWGGASERLRQAAAVVGLAGILRLDAPARAS